MNKQTIILGAGGHARVLADALLQSGRNVLGVVASVPSPRWTLSTIPMLGGDDVIDRYSPEDVELVCGIGSVAPSSRRTEVLRRFSERGYTFAPVVHPSAVISPHAAVAQGVQILAGAVVQTGAVIGQHAIVNTRASIDHDCRIGTSCHVACGAVLCGNVVLGDDTHVGAGATVIEGIVIGARCMIAAGAVVVRSVGDDQRLRGVPAKPMGT